MNLRKMISKMVNSGIAKRVKPQLISLYEKIYDWRKTIEMHFLSRKDDAYAKEHHLKIMNVEATLEYIIAHKCSVARYGDGEFNLLSNTRIGFQINDHLLVKQLHQIVQEDRENCLVCIPGIFSYEQDYDPSTRKFWKKILVHKRAEWYQFCNPDYYYGNADITRCYLEFDNKENTGKYFSLLKEIWDNRNVVIVEGKLTRLGVGNDLFENTSSIQRILCPATDAFSFYTQIKDYITMNVDRDKLILIALGPTATVLAFDLSASGYQAVDIGNVDKEYEWWLANAKCKQRNPIKFTMEVQGGTLVEDCLDQNYLDEVIHEI